MVNPCEVGIQTGGWGARPTTQKIIDTQGIQFPI